MNGPSAVFWCVILPALIVGLAAVVWMAGCELIERSTAYLDDAQDVYGDNEDDSFPVCSCHACRQWRESDDVNTWEQEINA